jgi:hypothetical protein
VKLTYYKKDKIDFTKKRDTKKYIREGTNVFPIHEKVTRTNAKYCDCESLGNKKYTQ